MEDVIEEYGQIAKQRSKPLRDGFLGTTDPEILREVDHGAVDGVGTEAQAQAGAGAADDAKDLG